ncbi:hypothetical protein chiPu_0031375, partial [Chiloscyllium punctatum]|nr:hypothetical protein [Chiloscyllium punctatum]
LSRSLCVSVSLSLCLSLSLSLSVSLSLSLSVSLSPLPPAQVAVWITRACIRINENYRRVKLVTKETLITDPYTIKAVRRLIDGCAFRIYGHWVKKGQYQNRAALFENSPKTLLQTTIDMDGENEQELEYIYTD